MRQNYFESGDYKLILNSDSPAFSGLNRVDDSITYTTLYNETDGRHFLKVYVPNRTALVFKKVKKFNRKVLPGF